MGQGILPFVDLPAQACLQRLPTPFGISFHRMPGNRSGFVRRRYAEESPLLRWLFWHP
jgi:hypothetical protein